jgi:hypothetical protein
MQQMGMAPNGQPIITSQLQPMVSFCVHLRAAVVVHILPRPTISLINRAFNERIET